ncbi:AAA family ATPase [Microbacterium sp. GXF6406]
MTTTATRPKRRTVRAAAEVSPKPRTPAAADQDGTLSPEDDAKVNRYSARQALKDETAEQVLRMEARAKAEEALARKRGLIGPWEPVDLTDVVQGIKDGTLPPIVPEMLRMEPSGRLLLYAGRVNGIHGHSNAGKSWTALLACKQALDAGETVFYIDYEDDERGIVERLLLVYRVLPKVVKERFIYLRPKTRFDQKSVGRMLERWQPSLVVIDAMGGSLSMEGLNFMDDNDIIKWTFLVSGFIAGHGAAVLLLDHLPKDTPPGTLWPTGSQRKRAAITGAQYLQERVIAFSRGKSGYAKIVAAKDRHGNASEAEVVAHLKVDSVHRRVKGRAEPQLVTRVSLVDAPSQEMVDAIKFKSTAKALCKALEDAGALAGADDKALTQTPLQTAVKGDKRYKVQVIGQLVQAGFIHADKRGKVADNAPTYHTLIKPWDDNWTPEELELVDPS